MDSKLLLQLVLAVAKVMAADMDSLLLLACAAAGLCCCRDEDIIGQLSKEMVKYQQKQKSREREG